MKLHTVVTGSGEEVALLHGWAMHSGVWAEIQKLLEPYFRVRVIDLPGHGDSPACDSDSLDTWCEALAENLPDKVHVCGWSLGGLLAMQYAILWPDRVSSLTLVGATPCFANRKDWAHGVDPAALETFSLELEHDYRGAMSRFLMLQAGGAGADRNVVMRLREIILGHEDPNLRALESGLYILLDTDLRNKVSSINQPVLIIQGEQDMLVRPGAAQWLSDELPRGKRIIMSNCAHAPMISHPAELAKHLTEFIVGGAAA